MTSKEKIEKAWELVNSKHIETNDEIQLVRYAVRMARDLVERDTPKKVIKEVDKKYVDTYEFYERDIYRCCSCKKLLIIDRYQYLQDNEKTNYCYYCGQRLDWVSENETKKNIEGNI